MKTTAFCGVNGGCWSCSPSSVSRWSAERFTCSSIAGEDPCPLCIIQRYFFVLIAVFAFLGAGLRGWRGVAVLEAMVALSALGGIVAAARHVYIQARPGFSCGFDTLQPIVDSLPPARWLPQVFKVAGLCETPYPPILGLSLPQWSLVAFAIIFLAVVASLRSKRRLRTPSM